MPTAEMIIAPKWGRQLNCWGRRVALACIGCWTLSCCWFSPWPRADELLGRLRCGMSRAEVTSIAKGFRGLELHEVHHAGPGNMVAQHADTLIRLEFGDKGLVRAQISWIDAIEHRALSPVKSFCKP